MQQRRLRLGDILDDYCPRERRVTNHVIVAMIDDDVKQTRCSTCDADHEYKGARVPPPRRKKDAGVLSADAPHEGTRVRRPAVEPVPEPDATESVEIDAPLAAAAILDEPMIDEEPAAPEPEDDGPVHRPLIRATFPRPEGQPPERREPDFTMRQPGARGGRELDGNRQPGQKRRRRHNGGGGRSGDVRFGGSPQGNNQRGGGSGGGNRGGHSQGPSGGNHQSNRGNANRPGGEGRFRRRRGR